VVPDADTRLFDACSLSFFIFGEEEEERSPELNDRLTGWRAERYALDEGLNGLALVEEQQQQQQQQDGDDDHNAKTRDEFGAGDEQRIPTGVRIQSDDTQRDCFELDDFVILISQQNWHIEGKS